MYLTKSISVIKSVYKPRYVALNILLAVAYYLGFLYLSYVQGGNAIMTNLPAYAIFFLIATSSILMTVSIYSVLNATKGKPKASSSAASIGTVVIGSGLCGCTTTLIPSVALAVGAGMPVAFALSSLIKNYSPEIISALIMANVLVIAYTINKLSKSKKRLKDARW